LRIGCWGEYLVLRGKKGQKIAENYIMSSFKICFLHQMLLG
jgi:hypothetical protein